MSDVFKPGDVSHIKEDDDLLRGFIGDEPSRESFTAVIITGINPAHSNYLRTAFKEWTRQLA